MAAPLRRLVYAVIEPTFTTLTAPPSTLVVTRLIATASEEAVQDTDSRQEPQSGGLHDTPGHELATGGLYDSSRKDREPLPDEWLKTTSAKGKVSEEAAHEDPSTSNQHPDQAFTPPSEGIKSENVSPGA